jgi:hypothetical protein
MYQATKLMVLLTVPLCNLLRLDQPQARIIDPSEAARIVGSANCMTAKLDSLLGCFECAYSEWEDLYFQCDQSKEEYKCDVFKSQFECISCADQSKSCPGNPDTFRDYECKEKVDENFDDCKARSYDGVNVDKWEGTCPGT